MFETSSFLLALIPGQISYTDLVHMTAVIVSRLELDLPDVHQILYKS